MANWCENILILRCNDSAQVQRAVKAYNENKLLWEFFPEPNRGDSDNASSDWCEQNWGCVSDAGKDVGRDGHSEKPIVVSKTSTLVALDFLSRWSPPVKAMKAFKKAGFSVELYYYESGMAFCGLYTSDSGDKRYDIPDTAAKIRAMIPPAINDAFAIAEWQELEAAETTTSGLYMGYEVLLLPHDPADSHLHGGDDMPRVQRPRKFKMMVGRPPFKDVSVVQTFIRDSIARADMELNENTKTEKTKSKNVKAKNTKAKPRTPEGGTLDRFMT